MNEIRANKLSAGSCRLPSFGWPGAIPAGRGGGWRGSGRCVRVAVTDMDLADGGGGGT